MKKRLRHYAILAALLLAWLPVTWAQSPPRVEKITLQHVGPQATSDDLIRANIRIKIGDPYVRTSVDDDVRTLYATGYFYNIRVGEEPTPGGVALTYVLQGKPTLTEIQFTGNQVSIDADWPPLAQANGRVEFSESGVNARALNAQFLGGPVTLGVAN